MKRLLHFIFIGCCTLFLLNTGGVIFAQSTVSDTLEWSWEVTSSTSTWKKDCLLGFSDSLLVDWGDGQQEWIGDSLSKKTLIHNYQTTGNYTCVVTSGEVSYFKADSKRLLTLTPQKAIGLTYLSCTSNQLTALDLSANVNLESLYCGSNDLTTLELSHLSNLETLTCSDNQLTALDLSALSRLKKVTCHTNLLSSLSVYSNGPLNYVSCHTCQLGTQALDALFNQLPVLSSVTTSQNLYIQDNPGSVSCNRELVTSKNWTLETIDKSCTVYIPSVSSNKGDSAVVDIWLENKVPIVAFEFDLLIPDGLVLDTVRSCLTPERRGEHLFSLARTSETSQLYKLMAYSMKSKDAFGGTDAPVVTLYLSAADTIASYKLDLKKAILVDTLTTLAEDVSISDGALTIKETVLSGDADGDQAINVTDIVWLVAKINGSQPAGFRAEAMDMNEDGLWNVLDVVLVVDLINSLSVPALVPANHVCFLSASVNNLGSSELFPVNNEAYATISENKLYVLQSQSTTNSLLLCLDNTDSVQALQTDLIFSREIELEASSVSPCAERVNNYQISLTRLTCEECRYRLLIWSMSPDQLLTGNEGSVIQFNLSPVDVSANDSLICYLEKAVITNQNSQTKTCTTFDSRFSLKSESVNQPIVGSSEKNRFWVKGNELKRISLYNLEGIVCFTEPCISTDYQEYLVASGFYLAVVEFEAKKAVLKLRVQ